MIRFSTILLIFALWNLLEHCHGAVDLDETRTFSKLIQSRGFSLQVHYVTTEDGYILTVHRVVPPDYNPANYSRTRKPVIAFHGLIAQSTQYFLSSPFLAVENSTFGDNFGFELLLTGRYDLWLPNARGNGLSNGHVRLSSRNREYWKFSWDHIAMYDLPAVLDLVKRETNHETVGYVGHSQGCAILFALLSLRPELARHFRPFISWAPAVYLSHAPSISLKAGQLIRPILEHFPGEMIFTKQFTNRIVQSFCRPGLGTQFICKKMFELMHGPSFGWNATRIPIYVNFLLAPSSNWQMAHFLQNAKSGRFARFRYPSKTENVIKYGQVEAPDYPLANIPTDIPLVIMYGATDYLVGPKDAHILIKNLRALGHNVINYRVPKEKWNHFDFLIGKDAGRLVYDKTIKFLNLFMWKYPNN